MEENRRWEKLEDDHEEWREGQDRDYNSANGIIQIRVWRRDCNGEKKRLQELCTKAVIAVNTKHLDPLSKVSRHKNNLQPSSSDDRIPEFLLQYVFR
jgi:hypothetical protein